MGRRWDGWGRQKTVVERRNRAWGNGMMRRGRQRERDWGEGGGGDRRGLRWKGREGWRGERIEALRYYGEVGGERVGPGAGEKTHGMG